MRPAVFLDRDGVLIEDVDLLVRADQLRLLEGVPSALRRLAEAGYALVVVSNQTVVARGLATVADVESLNRRLVAQLVAAGGPPLDGCYFCPHHPNASLADFRVDCACRKPRPGLIVRAAEELALDLSSSVMVGDRQSDVTAGALAGCRTVLVRTGRHADAPIETTLLLERTPSPDAVCNDVTAAADWILGA